MYVNLFRDLIMILPHDGNKKYTRNLFDHMLKIHKPDIFLDIGAIGGIYYWHAKNHDVPIIFMFESDQANVRLLAKTIKKNRYTGVFPIPCAVSDKFGASEFILDNVSRATGSLVDSSDNPFSLHSAYSMKSKVVVPTVFLDAYVDYSRDKKVFKKIDVQGAVTYVFEGAKQHLASLNPHIFVECFEPSRLQWFQEFGYQLMPLDDNFNFLLSPLVSDALCSSQ